LDTNTPLAPFGRATKIMKLNVFLYSCGCFQNSVIAHV
jgi:hypothetical protein